MPMCAHTHKHTHTHTHTQTHTKSGIFLPKEKGRKMKGE